MAGPYIWLGAAFLALAALAFAWQSRSAPLPGHARRGSYPAVDHRIEKGRRQVFAAVRRRQEALARFPLPEGEGPRPAPAPGWDRDSAFGWLGSRWVTGFLWGAVLGLALEAVAIILLGRLAADIRRVGL